MKTFILKSNSMKGKRQREKERERRIDRKIRRHLISFVKKFPSAIELEKERKGKRLKTK